MADWISREAFKKTQYGRLDKQLDGKNFLGPGERPDVPPGGQIVRDPKDGRFGIVVDREGKPICKATLEDAPRSRGLEF
jgi:hypothetical protein